MHLESPVVIVGFVSGEKIGRVRTTFVMINSAAEPAEIFLAVKLPGIVVRFSDECHGVAGMKDFPERGVEAGAEFPVGLRRQQAAEFAGVRVRVAKPAAFPASGDGIGRRRRLGGVLPIVVEGGTSAHQQKCERQCGESFQA